MWPREMRELGYKGTSRPENESGNIVGKENMNPAKFNRTTHTPIRPLFTSRGPLS